LEKYKNILNIEEISSTNVYLFSLLKEKRLPEISVVSAEFQTAGKGQRGNSWHSERGKNLLFSHVVFPQQLAATEQFILSQIVSLALCKTLQSYGIDACIKWANDIYVGDRKIAGVLIETQLSGDFVSTAVVGIGLNVNQIDFPDFLPNPTSMALCAHKEFDKNEVLQQYLQNFESYFAQLSEREKIHREYTTLLYRYKTPARFADAGGEFEGTIINVEPSGKLVIHHENGNLCSYYFKEVRFVICQYDNMPMC